MSKQKINIYFIVFENNIFHLLFGILLTTLFTSCSNKNNEYLFSKFQNEFNMEIEKHNALSFDFQYDYLVPQKSYFINSKLRLLKYNHSPENGNIECLIFFDKKTDQIEKIVRREVFYKWNSQNKKRCKSFTDTIHVIYFKKNKIHTFFNNKLIDSTFRKNLLKNDIKFIQNMRNETQKNYKYNLQKTFR